MDSPDGDGSAAVSPTSVELTSSPLEINVPPQNGAQITFCTHVGWDGTAMLLFTSGVSGLFIWIYSKYTKSFQAVHRPWVWLFLVLAFLYLLLTILYALSWKKLANTYSVDRPAEPGKGKNSISQKIVKVIFMFNINGVLFLWKLYLLEFVESINQLVNLITVYLCTLPVEISSCMCVALAVDAFYRAYQMGQPHTIFRRARQIKIDLFLDFTCVATPLILLYNAYGIPITIPEMLQLTLWPSLCIVSKTRSIFREIVRVRANAAMILQQERRSLKTNRRLKRSWTRVEMIAEKQYKQIPKSISSAFLVYNICYGILLSMVATVHLGIILDKPQFEHCNKITWEVGCKSKIPFCKSLFAPTCNCASLKLENNHSVTSLPNRLVDDMVGLRKVFIRNCNLTKLPPKMEQLTEMVYFEVSKNRLQAFNVDIREWKNLDNLVLMHNKISVYNEEALWSHPELSGLVLHNNRITLPDASRIYLPSLMFLSLKDNGLRIAQTLGRDQFPNLFHMHLNGNHLLNFPDQALKNQLGYLAVARCQLKSLPSYLSEFKQLVFLDARGNNITNVDDNLKLLMVRNGVETYFAGNDVCSTDSSLDCEPLCSKHCWSRRVSNDGYCDVDCGTEECQFDGGDCNDLKKTAL